MKIAAVALFVVVPGLASAQPAEIDGAPGSGRYEADLDAPPLAPASPVTAAHPIAPAPRELSPIELRSQAVAAQRTFVFGTALTVPEGRLELSARGLLPFAGVIGAAAGLTSTTELWVDAMAVLLEEADDGGYAIGIKQVIARGRSAQLAVTASIREIDDGGEETARSVGAVASVCVDPSCGGLISASLAFLSVDDESVPMLTLSGSLGRDRARFLAEVIVVEEGSFAMLGARFGGTSMAVDLGLGRSLGSDGEGETIPWLGLAGRL